MPGFQREGQRNAKAFPLNMAFPVIFGPMGRLFIEGADPFKLPPSAFGLHNKLCRVFKGKDGGMRRLSYTDYRQKGPGTFQSPDPFVDMKYLLPDQAGQRDGHKSLRAGGPSLVIEDADRLAIHL